MSDPIVVCGAGIVGLSAALGLSRAGLDTETVQLLEIANAQLETLSLDSQTIQREYSGPAMVERLGQGGLYLEAAAAAMRAGGVFRLIRDTGARGVVMLSGDTHYAEASCLRTNAPYPLWDFTSSGLTETWPVLPPNSRRVGEA